MKVSSRKDVDATISLVDSEPQALETCITIFSRTMRDKLLRKFQVGFRGWDNPEVPVERLIELLKAHVEKNDWSGSGMVDIANLAMFIWNRDGGKLSEEL